MVKGETRIYDTYSGKNNIEQKWIFEKGHKVTKEDSFNIIKRILSNQDVTLKDEIWDPGFKTNVILRNRDNIRVSHNILDAINNVEDCITNGHRVVYAEMCIDYKGDWAKIKTKLGSEIFYVYSEKDIDFMKIIGDEDKKEQKQNYLDCSIDDQDRKIVKLGKDSVIDLNNINTMHSFIKYLEKEKMIKEHEQLGNFSMTSFRIKLYDFEELGNKNNTQNRFKYSENTQQKSRYKLHTLYDNKIFMMGDDDSDHVVHMMIHMGSISEKQKNEMKLIVGNKEINLFETYNKLNILGENKEIDISGVKLFIHNKNILHIKYC